MASLRTGVLLLVALSFISPCGAQDSRPFSMSATSVQAYPAGSPLYQNNLTQPLSADVDVVTLFPEYLGVPFDLFASGSNVAASEPWAVQMTALAAGAKKFGKPLMLEIVLTRDVVVARAAKVSGKSVVQAGWAPTCADFTSPAYKNLGAAYINYARWMAQTFAPKYMVIAVEANLYYAYCGGNTASWQSLVSIERQTYDAVKAINPRIIAFPSFKLEDLYGQTLTGFDQVQYSAMANLKRDRLGLASYPYGIQVGTGFANPYQLPIDYLARIRNRNPSEPRIVITETGWNSAGLAVLSQGACFHNYIYSDASFQTAYMTLLLYSAYVNDFEHVSWWSDRDLIPSTVMPMCYPASVYPFPECNGDAWCQALNTWRGTGKGWSAAFGELAFKAFGSVGLREFDGAAKPGTLALWSRFLALPLN